MDTATPMTTVAVLVDNEVLAQRSHRDPRRHAELLTSFVREVMAEAQRPLSALQTVAVGVGPGAFTGLRVGLVTARTLGLALSVPVRGVLTLDALAFASGLDMPFAVVTDARRRQVYWATYDDFATRRTGPFVGDPLAAAREIPNGPVVGAAETPFAELFDDVRAPDLPQATAIGALAARRAREGVPPMPPEPVYLRRPDVTTGAGPKSVLT